LSYFEDFGGAESGKSRDFREIFNNFREIVVFVENQLFREMLRFHEKVELP